MREILPYCRQFSWTQRSKTYTIITYIPMQCLYTNTSPVMLFLPFYGADVLSFGKCSIKEVFWLSVTFLFFITFLILVHTLIFFILFVVIIIMHGHQRFSCYFCFSDWGRNCYIKTSSRSKGETVSRNQTAVGYNSMVTAKGWISPAVSKSTRNSDVCFSHFCGCTWNLMV